MAFEKNSDNFELKTMLILTGLLNIFGSSQTVLYCFLTYFIVSFLCKKQANFQLIIYTVLSWPSLLPNTRCVSCSYNEHMCPKAPNVSPTYIACLHDTVPHHLHELNKPRYSDTKCMKSAEKKAKWIMSEQILIDDTDCDDHDDEKQNEQLWNK